MQEIRRIPTIQKRVRRKRSNMRVLFLLAAFFVTVLLLLFFRSPLSEIRVITIEGARLLDEHELREKLDIHVGMQYLNVNAERIQKQLLAYPEVKTADVRKTFPGKLTITLEEYRRIAYVMNERQQLIPLLENGVRLSNGSSGRGYMDQPILREWRDEEKLKALVTEMAKLDTVVLDSISEIHHTPADTDPYRVTLYTRDGYRVVSSIRQFAENMKWYPAFVEKLEEGNQERRKGIIYMLEGKWFEPYPEAEAAENEK